MENLNRLGAFFAVLAAGTVLGIPLGVYLSGKGDLGGWLGFWGGAAGAIITVSAVVFADARRAAREAHPHAVLIMETISACFEVIEMTERFLSAQAGAIRPDLGEMSACCATISSELEEVSSSNGFRVPEAIGYLRTLMRTMRVLGGRFDYLDKALEAQGNISHEFWKSIEDGVAKARITSQRAATECRRYVD